MSDPTKLSRRGFIRAVAGAAALPVFGGLAFREAQGQSSKGLVYRINNCPVHDGQLRHVGLDSMLHLLSDNGVKFYKTANESPLGGPGGLIAADDVVLLKVNAQWRCRGATNTDLIRGMIHRILMHPDGFTGEVVIFENGQNRPGAFDGISNSPSNYKNYPEIKGVVRVNAEQEDLTTINYLVGTVFAGKPVSAILLDSVYNKWITATDHTTTGYRKLGSGATIVSYPCFTTAKGNRIELKEGRWTGTDYAQNVKLIHMPVLKDHAGDVGCTGALKIVYGTLSMKDGFTGNRHYVDLGTQCARMWTDVRIADLNILDCIWVGYEKNGCYGYPPSVAIRQNILLAGIDPVALDYYAFKHVLLPLGGSNASLHDPDNSTRLKTVITDAKAQINNNGGLNGLQVHSNDNNIQLISAEANNKTAAKAWQGYV